MDFNNSFTVNAPIDHVWTLLMNVQEVAPCVPGAELTEVVSEDEYKGQVKVKLGAVQMTYRGTIVRKEVDGENHRVVMSASGSETRGSGSASGTITSELVEDTPGRTTVNIHSQVNVTGRVAQFGRNIMQEVANRLIREFAQCLEQKVSSPEGGDMGPPDYGDVASPQVDVPAPTPPTASQSPASSSTQQADTSGAATTAAQPPVAPSPSATQSPPPAPHTGRSSSEPIRMLPLVLDVARSQVAAGLNKLADVIRPR